MKTILIILGVLVFTVFLCALVWKTAKIHELHKVRDSFEKINDIYRDKYGDQENPYVEGFNVGLDVIRKLEESEKKTIL